MSRRTAKYVMNDLGSQEDLLPQESRNPLQPSDSPLSSRVASLLFYATCVSALVTSVLTATQLASGAFNPGLTRRIQDYSTLRRPSTYMGLEKVLSNASRTEPFPTIVNFPPVLLQMEAGDPSRSLHEDSRQYFSYEGTVFPDDRRFAATKEISTVAQFKNLDYGMERCTLHASIPPGSDKFDPQADFHSPSVLDVWLLEEVEELSPYPRWDSAPRRSSLLTSLTVSAETNANSSSGEFDCPSGKFTTLEVACSHQYPDCRVMFWQKRLSAPAGIYMTQQDSLV